MRDIDPTASEFITSGYLKNSRVGGLMYDPATIATAVAPQLIGGLMGGGSDAPQRGADQQVQANNAAIGEQRAAAAQQRADLAPWTQSGGAANNELMRRLGIGGNGRIGSYTPKTMDQLRSEMRGQFTSQVQRPQTAPNLLQNDFMETGGEFGTYNRTMGNRFSPEQTQTQSQFDQAGFDKAVQGAYDAQGAAREGEVDPEYGSLLKAAPAYKRFSQDDLNNDLVYQNGLQFGLDTGTNQINDRAASGGNYGSGAALKALTRFGNDYGTTKTEGAYTRNFNQQADSYNRNMAGKNQIFNFLSGPSQQGQSAAAMQGAAGLNSANQVGGYMAGNGNALSAGTIGSANAVNGQVGQVTDAFRWNQMLNRNKTSSSYNPTTAGMGMDRYLSGNLGSGD